MHCITRDPESVCQLHPVEKGVQLLPCRPTAGRRVSLESPSPASRSVIKRCIHQFLTGRCHGESWGDDTAPRTWLSVRDASRQQGSDGWC